MVSKRLAALERAIAEIVDELKKQLPRMGRKAAVDSTDIESCANPRRTLVDAVYGVPLAHAVRPANEGDTVKLRSLMETANSAHG